jgi:hypothetical protein
MTSASGNKMNFMEPVACAVPELCRIKRLKQGDFFVETGGFVMAVQDRDVDTKVVKSSL